MAATPRHLLLFQAQDSALGTVIQTDDVAALVRQLTIAKGQSPVFKGLAFRRSPDRPDCEVWITREGINPEEELKKKALRDEAINDILGDLLAKEK